MPSSKHLAVLQSLSCIATRGGGAPGPGGTETEYLLNVHGAAPHHRVISLKMSIVPNLRSPDFPTPRACELLPPLAARLAALNAAPGGEKFSTSTNVNVNADSSLLEDHRLVPSAEAAAAGGH